ncbi:hypothetical protein NCCP1664_06860 [Zafaria cholistanensis]|uniref:Transcription regulator PadR N-terminal domain-containing protein n=2 Tax=Micrococcaceae TaxID=1268 RepID=A0A5A7NNJ7_9MICC|nr:PadR family transcriptional regulator [Zafaria cholistanensis]GER22189.1 hypothetical protein NCCP1664_06860 [Zafaria cholistanensis]
MPAETGGFPRYPGTWQRALLPMCLLAGLENGSNHGYALAKKLEERGFSPLKGATLYPALGKLEEAGYIRGAWKEGRGAPGRKVYALTASGRERLRTLRMLWDSFQSTVSRPHEQ